jgi:hypothetical protein
MRAVRIMVCCPGSRFLNIDEGPSGSGGGDGGRGTTFGNRGTVIGGKGGHGGTGSSGGHGGSGTVFGDDGLIIVAMAATRAVETAAAAAETGGRRSGTGLTPRCGDSAAEDAAKTLLALRHRSDRR